MAWQFILTDLVGQQIGEITNASERKVNIPHMRPPSATFKVPLRHELANQLLNDDCLIKCYRKDPLFGTSSLAFHGPIVTAEEVGQAGTQSINVTCAGPLWRLTKRIVPGSLLKTGIAFGLPTPIDLGQIAHNILQDCNAVPNGFTGIWPGSLSNSIVGSVGPWHLKNAAEAITELSAGASSFEYSVVPTEPVNRGFAWPQIALMNCAPIVGQNRPDSIFEYGTSRANVTGYTHQVSRDGLLTRAHISVSGWPDALDKDPSGVPLHDLITRDSDQIATRGLFEEVVNDAGVTDNGLRTNIADFHLLIRKQPRQIVTFNPATNQRPVPFLDYEVGDFVRARAMVNDSQRFDAMFRVWGLTFNIDDAGSEMIELELVMP